MPGAPVLLGSEADPSKFPNPNKEGTPRGVLLISLNKKTTDIYIYIYNILSLYCIYIYIYIYVLYAGSFNKRASVRGPILGQAPAPYVCEVPPQDLLKIYIASTLSGVHIDTKGRPHT